MRIKTWLSYSTYLVLEVQTTQGIGILQCDSGNVYVNGAHAIVGFASTTWVEAGGSRQSTVVKCCYIHFGSNLSLLICFWNSNVKCFYSVDFASVDYDFIFQIDLFPWEHRGYPPSPLLRQNLLTILSFWFSHSQLNFPKQMLLIINLEFYDQICGYLKRNIWSKHLFLKFICLHQQNLIVHFLY